MSQNGQTHFKSRAANATPFGGHYALKSNALTRLKKVLGSEERKALIFVKTFVINNYESTCEDLFNKTEKPNMNLRRTRRFFL